MGNYIDTGYVVGSGSRGGEQMALKRIRRIVKVICPDCWDAANVATCDRCGGKGEIDKVITEIVEAEEGK